MMCIQAFPYTDHQCTVGFTTGAFAHGSIFSTRKHIVLLSQVTMLLLSPEVAVSLHEKLFMFPGP